MHDHQHSDKSESADFRYRVVYDVAARLSCNINQCDDIEQIEQVLNKDIKYLFDCECMRVCLVSAEGFKTICVGTNKELNGVMNALEQDMLLPFEDQVLHSQIPQFIDGREAIISSSGHYYNAELFRNIETIWVWAFHSGALSLIASVFSGPRNAYRRADIPALKITCEAVLARMKGLQLLHEISAARNELEDAMKRLETKREMISKLMEEKELEVEQRTSELKLRNEKLSAIVKFNAHNIREPLTRIFGLMEVMKISTPEDIMKEIVPMLHASSEDLDKEIKRVINFIEKE